MSSTRAMGGVRRARVAAAGVGIGAVLWWGGQATMTAGWAYAEPVDSSAVSTQESVPGSGDEAGAADVPADNAGQAVDSGPAALEPAPPPAESGDTGPVVTEPAAPTTSEEEAVTSPAADLDESQNPVAQPEPSDVQPSESSESADVQPVPSGEHPA